jgi:hypothetical protein
MAVIHVKNMNGRNTVVAINCVNAYLHVKPSTFYWMCSWLSNWRLLPLNLDDHFEYSSQMDFYLRFQNSFPIFLSEL